MMHVIFLGDPSNKTIKPSLYDNYANNYLFIKDELKIKLAPLLLGKVDQQKRETKL